MVESVPACFFFVGNVDRSVTGYQICCSCEEVTGDGGITGAQRLHGLWRIYPATTQARNQLLMKGVTIGGIYVPIIGTNPHLVDGASDTPTIKIIIGNIGLSVADTEIEKELKNINGLVLRSKLYDECYRDENGKLSLFKSGRRFAYISEPPHPLPREFQVGKWKATLYHPGQKRVTESNTSESNLQSGSNNANIQGSKNVGEVADVTPDNGDRVKDGIVGEVLGVTPDIGDRGIDQNVQGNGLPSATPVQSHLDSYIDTTRRERSFQRSPRGTTRSLSRKRMGSVERMRGINPKASKQQAVSPAHIDYFDFNQQLARGNENPG